MKVYQHLFCASPHRWSVLLMLPKSHSAGSVCRQYAHNGLLLVFTFYSVSPKHNHWKCCTTGIFPFRETELDETCVPVRNLKLSKFYAAYLNQGKQFRSEELVGRKDWYHLVPIQSSITSISLGVILKSTQLENWSVCWLLWLKWPNGCIHTKCCQVLEFISSKWLDHQ